MNIDELAKQMAEYQMRVEQVLNGMDVLLTRFDKRINNLESRLKSLDSGLPSGTATKDEQRMISLEGQVKGLNTALRDLLDELDHDWSPIPWVNDG